MQKGTGLREFAFVIWGLCYLLAIVVGIFFAKETQPFSGYMHPSFVILSYGVSVAFLATHYLVFLGAADKNDLLYLAKYFVLYAITAFIFVPDPARWIQFFAITIIALGLETAFPDWPVRIYNFLTGKQKERDWLSELPKGMDRWPK